MKKIVSVLLCFFVLSTLFCPLISANAVTEELYFDFDGTENYDDWCLYSTDLIERGMYRLVAGVSTASGGFILPDVENFTIESRIRYSNTAPIHNIYTMNHGIYVHMLYDGVYVENGKERLYSEKVDVGKDWHIWKFRFLNDGENYEIYVDGNLILEGETESTGGTHPGKERYSIYKLGETGENYGVFEMDWRSYAPETNAESAKLNFDFHVEKTNYTEGENVVVRSAHIGTGMDNIYKVQSDGTWTLYARQGGTNNAWVEITSGKTAAHTNNKTLMVGSGLGINSVVAYTKRNSTDIAYSSGDSILASFDADNTTDLAKAYVQADGSGNAGSVKTVTCKGETFAYASGGSRLLEIPMCPRYATTWGGDVYVQFRTHAITEGENDKHLYLYFANTHRIVSILNQELYQSADSSLSLKPDRTNAEEVNYIIDGQVVAVGKKENDYEATISGLKPGTYSVYAEYKGKTTKPIRFEVASTLRGELKVSNSTGDAEVELDIDNLNERVQSVDFFVDGNPVVTSNAEPFSTSVSLTAGTSHTVSAIARAQSGVVLGRFSTPVYPDLSGDQPSTNYSNEVRYSVSGNTGTASVNISNGTYKLYLEHTPDGFTCMTNQGEEIFQCGTGDFIILTDAYAADVYYNGMLVKSFAMPMTTEVEKSTTNNGLLIENFQVVVPEERVTHFSRTNICDEKSYTEVPYLPYAYVADMVMERMETARFYIKDGRFRTDIKIEDGKVYAIAKLRKLYQNELGSYFDDAAPVWRMLGELPEVNGDVHIRVETMGGISRIYANDRQIGVFRGVVIAGGTGVAFDIEEGSAIKKFTISDATDVYYYEDDFSGKSNYSSADFWKGENAKIDFDQESGKLFLDCSETDGGWITLNATPSNAEISADVQITNDSGGFWYTFGKQDIVGGFVGYNFETNQFELGETVRGKTTKIAESAGSIPMNSQTNWTIKTTRDKETDLGFVELYIDGVKVISGHTTCQNNGNIGFVSARNTAYINNIKYRGNAKLVMGVIEYKNLSYCLTRGFVTEEGTYFVGENKKDYLFTNDGGKSFTNVPYNTGGVNLFDSFVRLDNGDLLGIDHGSYHPVSIEGGRASLQYTYLSKDNGMNWEFHSIIRPETPYGSSMENRAYKTSTGRIINSNGDEAGTKGWTGEDFGTDTIIYSDDNGLTWKSTDIVRSQEIGMVIAESVAMELSDGTIRMFFRTSAGAINYIDSYDNGTSFDFTSVRSTPFEANVNCFNITKDPTDTKTLWAAWGYDWGYEGISNSQWPRERYSLAVSYNEGETWEYVGTLKEVNYDHQRYDEVRGNMMNAGVFVDDKAVYVRFLGTEEADNKNQENFQEYQFVVDKSKIVPTKSWEKLHFRNSFYQVESALNYVMKPDRVSDTMIVGTDANNLFLNQEVYRDVICQGYIQAEYVATFIGADVEIAGDSVVFTKAGFEEVFSGEAITKVNGKTFVSTKEFAERYDYDCYEQDGYIIVSKYAGWRDMHNEVLLYTIGDYIEPPVYDAVKLRDNWRAYLADMEEDEDVSIDYCDGDYVMASFEASNQEDVAQITTHTGMSVESTQFGNEKFIYAPTSGSDYIDLKSVLPELSGEEVTYVKLRVHAMSGSGKNIYVHSSRSGNRRAHHAITDKEFGVKGMISEDVSAPAVDIIFEMRASDVDKKADVYTVYMRPVNSDGTWIKGKTNEAYGNTNGLVGLHIYNGIAVSDVKVYRKVDDITSAFNSASRNQDVAAMRIALSTYAKEYGVDLNELNQVINDEAVYKRLFRLSFKKPNAVGAAFDEAISVQRKEEASIDYTVGDDIAVSFDPSKQSDLERINKDALGNKVGTGEWTTFTNKEGTFVQAKDGSISLPICPGFEENENIYIKFRVRAMTDDSSQGGFHVYFANTHRIRNYLTESYYQEADPGLAFNTSSHAMDNIYEITPSGEWTHYARNVGDNREWVKIASGQTAAHTNLKYWSLHSSLAVSNITVYTKQPPVGTKISRTGISGKWSFKVTTDREIMFPAKVYLGAYDEEGRLHGITIGDYKLETSLEMPIPSTGDVKYFKAFIWDQNFDPVAKRAILDK